MLIAIISRAYERYILAANIVPGVVCYIVNCVLCAIYVFIMRIVPTVIIHLLLWPPHLLRVAYKLITLLLWERGDMDATEELSCGAVSG
jgi:hypothetical protein